MRVHTSGRWSLPASHKLGTNGSPHLVLLRRPEAPAAPPAPVLSSSIALCDSGALNWDCLRPTVCAAAAGRSRHPAARACPGKSDTPKRPGVTVNLLICTVRLIWSYSRAP